MGQAHYSNSSTYTFQLGKTNMAFCACLVSSLATTVLVSLDNIYVTLFDNILVKVSLLYSSWVDFRRKKIVVFDFI